MLYVMFSLFLVLVFLIVPTLLLLCLSMYISQLLVKNNAETTAKKPLYKDKHGWPLLSAKGWLIKLG